MDIKDVGVLLGLVISVGLGIWNLRHTLILAKRRDFISTVTSERIKWIESLRQNVSRYTGTVHSFFHIKLVNQTRAQELLEQFDVLGYLIRLQLNPNESPDTEIQNHIRSIPSSASKTSFTQLEEELNELTSLTQQLLKKEWEKVKEEAEGGKLAS